MGLCSSLPRQQLQPPDAAVNHPDNITVLHARIEGRRIRRKIYRIFWKKKKKKKKMSSREVKEYLCHHHISRLLESLLTGLMYHRPDDPVSFLQSCLIRTRHLGGPEVIIWDTFIHLERNQLDPRPPKTPCVKTQTGTLLTPNIPPTLPPVLPEIPQLPPITPQMPPTSPPLPPPAHSGLQEPSFKVKTSVLPPLTRSVSTTFPHKINSVHPQTAPEHRVLPPPPPGPAVTPPGPAGAPVVHKILPLPPPRPPGAPPIPAGAESRPAGAPSVHKILPQPPPGPAGAPPAPLGALPGPLGALLELAGAPPGPVEAPPPPAGAPPGPAGAPPVHKILPLPPPRPTGAPTVPAGAEPGPAGAPSVHKIHPRPAGTPPRPAGALPGPARAERRPAGAPSVHKVLPRPAGAPPGPVEAPPGPAGAPPGPAGAPPGPVGALPGPLGALPGPVGAPPRPAGAPLGLAGAPPVHKILPLPPTRPAGAPTVPTGAPPVHTEVTEQDTKTHVTDAPPPPGPPSPPGPPGPPGPPALRSQLSIDSDSDMTESSGLLQEVSILPPQRPRPFIIFVIGGPGSGKGSQTAKLTHHFGLRGISLDELLRRQLLSDASPSRKWEVISEMMSHGELGPQEDTIAELRRQLIGQQEVRGFIVDGFPRDVHQALSFQEQVGSPDLVMLLLCSNEMLRCRLQRRAARLGLLGDSSHGLRRRLDMFQRDIVSISRYYRQLRLLTQVDGDRDEEAVFADLCSVVREKLFLKNQSDAADVPECTSADPAAPFTSHL